MPIETINQQKSLGKGEGIFKSKPIKIPHKGSTVN